MRITAAPIADLIDTRATMRAALVLAPMAAAALLTGRPVWLQGALVTASAFIAMETTRLAPLGVVLHGLAIVGGFLLLLAALASPPVFVVAAAVMAAGAVLLTAKGHKLRTLGNFTFIPALYLACETAEGSRGDAFMRGVEFLPCMVLALLPVVALAAAEHLAEREPHVRWLRHLRGFHRRTADLGTAAFYGEAMIAVTLAVGLAALLVEWRHIEHAQWVVWSAASVVTGDAAGARRKLGDRLIGAFVGVPLGGLAGMLAPHTAFVLGLSEIGAVMTLLCFRRYYVAFGLRCALVAFALIAAGQSASVAAERVGNVVLGGTIGILFVIAVHALSHFKTASPSNEASFRNRGHFWN